MNGIMKTLHPKMRHYHSPYYVKFKLLPISSFQRNAFFKEGIGLVFYTMVNGVASSFAKNTSSITEEKGGIQWPNLQNHVNGMT
mmetsp:Transcript_19113/g.28054  ORF Transcript_19113/g.28054 Transcript_19113/m.28054 type:complete len:84 (+) Transcript_19113:180-431(+)